jgi:hypothetical protein
VLYNYYRDWGGADWTQPWATACDTGISQLARYYGSPSVLSMRDAVFIEGRRDEGGDHHWSKWATLGDGGGHFDLGRGADVGADVLLGFFDEASRAAAADAPSPRLGMPLVRVPFLSGAKIGARMRNGYIISEAGASSCTSFGAGAGQEPVVTRSTGDWHLVTDAKSADGATLYKPGWLGSAANSELELDTGISSTGNFQLTYIKSYQMQGVVSVSCMPPCRCKQMLLSAGWKRRVQLTQISTEEHVTMKAPSAAAAAATSARVPTCRIVLRLLAPSLEDALVAGAPTSFKVNGLQTVQTARNRSAV